MHSCTKSKKKGKVHYLHKMFDFFLFVSSFFCLFLTFSLTHTDTQTTTVGTTAHPAESLNCSVIVASSSQQGHRELSLCWQTLEHTIRWRWICHNECARMGQWRWSRWERGPWSHWAWCVQIRSMWCGLFKGPAGAFVMDRENEGSFN